MTDIGRKIADSEVAALVKTEEGYGRLFEPHGGFEALATVIRAGKLDDYLHDWAPRAADGAFEPILTYAVDAGAEDVVAALLERGANPNRAMVEGAPSDPNESYYDVPLGVAVNSPKLTRLLLEHGADVHLLSNESSILLKAVGEDADVVRILLKAGADPLLRTGVDTPLSFAARNPNYTGAETLALLQAAARKQLVGKRIASLTCKAGKNPQSTASARGVRAFANFWLEHDWPWAIVFVKASRAESSQALQRYHAGSDLRSSPTEPIFDEHRPVFVVELAGMPWTIIIEEVGTRFTEDRLRGPAAALSKTLGCETVGFGLWEGVRYLDGVLEEAHGDDWDPDFLCEKLEIASESAREREMERIFKQQLDVMDRWFADQDIFLPRLAYDSDGCVLKLDIRGIKKKDVVGHDVVIVKVS